VSGRPPVWIGHAVLTVSDVERAATFFRAVGMREVERNTEVAIMELRGGTHLVLVPGDVTPGDAPFDLMVEDLSAIHTQWTEQGLAPGEISHDRIHDSFVVTDPDGHRLTIRNSHVIGEV
jgi:catechol 2,3-dioxygenase-like lactoylglutathione lyase family enzyme